MLIAYIYPACGVRLRESKRPAEGERATTKRQSCGPEPHKNPLPLSWWAAEVDRSMPRSKYPVQVTKTKKQKNWMLPPLSVVIDFALGIILFCVCCLYSSGLLQTIWHRAEKTRAFSPP